MAQGDNKWLTIDQVGTFQECSDQAVRRLMKRGNLVPDSRVGRRLLLQRETPGLGGILSCEFKSCRALRKAVQLGKRGSDAGIRNVDDKKIGLVAQRRAHG